MLKSAPLLQGTILIAALLAGACALHSPPVQKGQVDLSTRDWGQGPVVLSGEWGFNEGFRPVPDGWKGADAGGPDGRGWGTYRLKILANPDTPLALRYTAVLTAFSLSVNGTQLAQVGHPDRDPRLAVSAYAPGTVRLPAVRELDLELFVSNHDYRVGGLWQAPQIGPAQVVEHGQWAEEAAELVLATALGVIGVAALLLFAYRRSATTFAYLGLFAVIIALRSLVTGEYPLVRIVPGLPFDVLIRLEYWTAFLPLPAAAAFFFNLYPGLMPRWARWAMVVPSLVFATLPFFLPLDLLTRAIPWYYPTSIPALLYGTFVLVRRILREGQNVLMLAGVLILLITGLSDTIAAAFFVAATNLVPWGLGLFVALQATSLVKTFLSTFQATEAHLAEKEFLIREIHHRVKNSLQVVASLVTLQARRLEDEGQREVFQALRRRVTAIALVQEKLYAQGKGGTADVGDYLRELVHLQYSGDMLEEGLEWTLSGGPLAADADYCVDVGLILTELVANAHKHGAAAEGSTVKVSVGIGDKLSLEVDDHGPGFAPGFAISSSQGLGLQVVSVLLTRHDGAITFLPGPGGRVRVELKLPSASV
jgi:two-component sensor histidine kinase